MWSYFPPPPLFKESEKNQSKIQNNLAYENLTWVYYTDYHWNRPCTSSCCCMRTDEHDETNFPKCFYLPVQHSQAHTSRYVSTISLMHIIIIRCKLEISDKILDGLGKCFILVLYFTLPYNKISFYYSSDMERSRRRIWGYFTRWNKFRYYLVWWIAIHSRPMLVNVINFEHRVSNVVM